MDDGSPKQASSRASPQMLPFRSRNTQGLRPRVSDVRARGGDANCQAAEDDRSNSSDIRRQRSSAARECLRGHHFSHLNGLMCDAGGVHDGPQHKSSMNMSEIDPTDAGSPGENHGEPRRHVIRLTLTEAAEEIKRLRRAERQHAAETKLREEEKKNLTEEASRLRQQLADSERARREEQATLQSAYDRDTTKLKDQLKETRDELQGLQEISLPLIEARKLTFKALRKGRALQYMAQLYTNNTLVVSVKREALHKLLENAVGTDHAVFRATHGFACGVQSYTDSHLRLLRQEQLILLAENERLQAQIQDMQERTEISRRDRLLQHESSLAGKSEVSSRKSRLQSKSSTFASRGGVPIWKRERYELQVLPSSLSVHEMNAKVKDAEMDVADAKLRSIRAVLSMGRTRLLSYAFRRLFAHSVSESAVQTMENALNKTSTAFKKESILTGSALVTSFVRTSEKASVIRAFWMMVLRSKAQSYAQEVQALNEQLKQARQRAAATENQGYRQSTCRACHAWSILSSDLDQCRELPRALQGGTSVGGFGLAPSQGGGIPLPVAYAPHYFRDLPSTQKRRNMYFTTAPPRAPQQSFPTSAQRARDMARTQETFYRPITTVEGWQQTGGNGLGIGMEPVGTVVGSHAASQETKLGAAKDTLKGTLLLPSTTPASQPLSAAERNDAYMEQLLRVTDQRLKLH
ncbi:hypothetical protein Esti_000062 [Eimeria stiedai]